MNFRDADGKRWRRPESFIVLAGGYTFFFGKPFQLCLVTTKKLLYLTLFRRESFRSKSRLDLLYSSIDLTNNGDLEASRS